MKRRKGEKRKDEKTKRQNEPSGHYYKYFEEATIRNI